MRHSFNKSLHDKCAVCGRNEADHTDSAQCEACSNTGLCEVINGMLLCAVCHAKENSVATAPITNDTRADRIAELTRQFCKEVATTYFTSNVTAIVDIEHQISDAGGNRYDVAQAIEARFIAQREAMIFNRIGADLDQKYLNVIVPSLREEEREKFKQYDISYKPAAVVAVPVISKPRMSKEDRIYAATAARYGLTVEQYKAKLEKMYSVTANESCTCAETPGICKVHHP